MRTEYYRNGELVRVEDDGLPPPPPQEATRFDQFTPRELVVALVTAFRSAGAITQPQAAAIRDSLVEQLKR